MEFLHAAIALLASMVLILAAMVGWLYWQQTRLFQNMNNVIMVVGELARPPSQEAELAELAELSEKVNEAVAEVAEAVAEEERPGLIRQPSLISVHLSRALSDSEDDRVSVEDGTEVVSGPPPPVDVDTLQDKTTIELKDMLTKRGIPFGKRDSKTVLISLLKATA